jgi:hypothetical protein
MDKIKNLLKNFFISFSPINANEDLKEEEGAYDSLLCPFRF